MKPLAICLMSVLVVSTAGGPSQAGVIFSEDFESLSDGNLSGQGGWTTSGGPIYLDSTGSNLGSRVVDGFTEGVVGGDNIRAFHDVDLSGGDLIELSFDAYASSNVGGQFSHNDGVGLTSDTDDRFILGWVAITSIPAPGGSSKGWFFDARKITENDSNYVEIVGGYDTPVSMTVLLDKQHLEVFGRYDLGSGNTGETTHFAVTATQANALSRIQILEDWSGARTGIEVDNIQVTVNAVPEPSSLALLGLGALTLFGCRRRGSASRRGDGSVARRSNA